LIFCLEIRRRLSLPPFPLLILAPALTLLVACSGGGGGSTEGGQANISNNPPVTTTPVPDGSGAVPTPAPEPIPGPTASYLSPGNYAVIPDCVPFLGTGTAGMKIIFANLDQAPHFDLLVDDAINNQFKTLAPFSEFFMDMAFYQVDISDPDDYECQGVGGSLSGSGFTCNNEKIHQAINDQCIVDDISGVIKIVITESEFGGAADEVIYIGDNPLLSDAQAISAHRNVIVHEVGHNFGLADLYGGGYFFDGSPQTGWPSSVSRKWFNLDGPGCPSWCDDFKPSSEYVLSVSASCPAFPDKDSCITFNRDAGGDCEDVDGDSDYDCCAWSDDTTDDYFNSQCTPVWGVEDIGFSCLLETGCFYGGAYGNNSWRPVQTIDESIMYDPNADTFDSVSLRSLRETLRCCISLEDSDASCSDSRIKIADFLWVDTPFKQRLGSCGVIETVPAP
jgi:hypothetical protein